MQTDGACNLKSRTDVTDGHSCAALMMSDIEATNRKELSYNNYTSSTCDVFGLKTVNKIYTTQAEAFLAASEAATKLRVACEQLSRCSL